MTINTYTTFTATVPTYIVGETYLFLPPVAAAYVTAGVATTGGTVDVPDPVYGLAAIQMPTLIGTATKPAGFAVVGADANISLVLAPKGTGALIAQLPDNGVAGGSARGAGATDWQTSRTQASQVSSGTTSVIGGGINSTASGTSSVVSGGEANTASALRSAISGGGSNAANGANSWIPGGQSSTSRALTGRGAWASGAFATVGDAQSGEFVLRAITTSATAVRATGDGAVAAAGNTINLPNSGAYMLRFIVVARQTAGSAGTAGDTAGWEMTALIKRGANAAATVLIGSSGTAVAPLYSDAAAAAWRISLTVDTTQGGINVTGTGEVNKTIRWVVRVLSVETTS